MDFANGYGVRVVPDPLQSGRYELGVVNMFGEHVQIEAIDQMRHLSQQDVTRALGYVASLPAERVTRSMEYSE